MATFDIKMPKMGESVTEGTITVINVRVGDFIEEDTDLFEITSAKTAATIPSPVAGKVIKINYEEGDTVPIGLPVIVVDTDGEASTEVIEDKGQGQTEGYQGSAQAYCRQLYSTSTPRLCREMVLPRSARACQGS